MNNNISSTEQSKGFSKTGILLLKNIIDKIEYHLYDSAKVESYDINEELETYYKSKERVHLLIKNVNTGEVLVNETGKLYRKVINKVVKYYINIIEDIDIEELLFNNTEELIHIEIKRIDEIEDVAIEEGDKGENEPREEKS